MNSMPSTFRATLLAVAIVANLFTADVAMLRAQQATAAPEATDAAASEFPRELVEWKPAADQPVFQGAGTGHWDAKIRERGWIMLEDDTYRMWYTGYDGSRAGIKQLGYATSPDGLNWTRYPGNPLVKDHWVEDMMVVKQGDTYYMFAEGTADRAQLLTSTDRVHWKPEGTLDIRDTTGKPISAGPFGTPTAWFENDTWYLFYERMDQGVWLATTKGLDKNRKAVWTNVDDKPLIVPGPEGYDRNMIAMNQVVKHEGAYYGLYHGSGDSKSPRKWSTDIARSSDLVHWNKYAGNPIVGVDTSSGILVPVGDRFRLYTMHDHVEVFESPTR